MTYEIIKYRVGRADQYIDRVTQTEGNNGKRCFGVNGPIWDIPTAVLSIYRRGSQCKRQVSGTGEKGSVHGEVAGEFDQKGEKICESNGRIFERYRHRGIREIFKEKMRWLRMIKKKRLNVFIILID
jgi:hypothetical protein